jgi:hypothetical protein
MKANMPKMKFPRMRSNPTSTAIDTANYNCRIPPAEQKDELWNAMLSNKTPSNLGSSSDGGCPDRVWPTYDSVISHVTTQDYRKHLTCPFDTMVDQSKTICPHGVVCCAKMEMFPFPQDQDGLSTYTGLLTPGTTAEHCLIRLSSAIRPLDQGVESDFARTMVRNAVGEKFSKAKIVPGVAIKVFRGNNRPSGNLLFLGSKVGQLEEDFFAHCVCTTSECRITDQRIWASSDGC